MNGMELSKAYFEECALPVFNRELSEYIKYSAFGLVGEGSECFELDDYISKDHDFSPSFCIWLPKRFINDARKSVYCALNKLPASFKGYDCNIKGSLSERRGLFSIEDFYYKYTKKTDFPLNNLDWLNIPESYLATCTNGRVFVDYYGEFTRIRNYLIDFYPEDVVKKKLSAYVAMMAQSGQYNMPRSHIRKDLDAYYFSKAEFIKNCYGALYLLASSYKPYYKLAGKKIKDLDYYPKEIFEDINKMQGNNNFDSDIIIVERICKYISTIISIRYNIKSEDNFMIDMALKLQESIADKDLKALHVMKGNENA